MSDNQDKKHPNHLKSDLEKKAKTTLQYVLNNDDKINVFDESDTTGLYVLEKIEDDAVNVKCHHSSQESGRAFKINEKEFKPLEDLLEQANINFISPKYRKGASIYIPLDQDGIEEKLDMLKDSVSELNKTNEADPKVNGGKYHDNKIEAPVSRYIN